MRLHNLDLDSKEYDNIITPGDSSSYNDISQIPGRRKLRRVSQLLGNMNPFTGRKSL